MGRVTVCTGSVHEVLQSLKSKNITKVLFQLSFLKAVHVILNIEWFFVSVYTCMLYN